MKTNLYKYLAVFVALALFLSACGGAATPDAAAIATSAVQTVEARYTQQAVQTPTPTSTTIPAAAASLTPTTDAPAAPAATFTPQPLQSNGKPCYAASVTDLTIPDGMIIAPGAVFTKKWRLFNLGNCPWDSTYALTFDSGDAMGTVTKFPLTSYVAPGASVDLSIDFTAPTTKGIYTGFWRMSTPYGGTFGVGTYDQSIFVKINVSSDPADSFGVSSVTYDWTRDPPKGCNSSGGMLFTVYATVTVNGPGILIYHWDRNPYDGGPLDGGRLKFTAAGSAVVHWTWTLRNHSVHDIDRWIAFTVDSPASTAKQYGRVLFPFTCK